MSMRYLTLVLMDKRALNGSSQIFIEASLYIFSCLQRVT